MTFEEVMEGLCHNYLKGTSEVVAEIDKDGTIVADQ